MPLCPYAKGVKGTIVHCELAGRKVSSLKYPCKGRYQACPIYRARAPTAPAAQKEEEAQQGQTEVQTEAKPAEAQQRRIGFRGLGFLARRRGREESKPAEQAEEAAKRGRFGLLRRGVSIGRSRFISGRSKGEPEAGQEQQAAATGGQGSGEEAKTVDESRIAGTRGFRGARISMSSASFVGGRTRREEAKSKAEETESRAPPAPVEAEAGAAVRASPPAVEAARAFTVKPGRSVCDPLFQANVILKAEESRDFQGTLQEIAALSRGKKESLVYFAGTIPATRGQIRLAAYDGVIASVQVVPSQGEPVKCGEEALEHVKPDMVVTGVLYVVGLDSMESYGERIKEEASS